MLIGMLLVFNEKIMLICIVNFITIQITMMYCTVYSIDRFKNKHVMTIYVPSVLLILLLKMVRTCRHDWLTWCALFHQVRRPGLRAGVHQVHLPALQPGGPPAHVEHGGQHVHG